MSTTTPTQRRRARVARLEKKHGVTIRRSRAGLGLFTTVPRAKDDFIIEYTGKRLTDEEANRRGGMYLFTVRKNLVLDGSGREHLARYINHSCRPNCYAELDEARDAINIKAKRAIAAGEELTYHYGKAFFDDHIKPYGCRCEKCAEQRTRRARASRRPSRPRRP